MSETPLIGRTCVIVDVTTTTPEGVLPEITETIKSPGIIMDATSAPTTMRTGESSMSITETWVLLVLLEGGRLRCVSHRDVIVQ